MARGEPIKVYGFLCMEDGSIKRIEDLTEQELNDYRRKVTHRLSRVMSEYYRLHPEAAELLEEVSPEEKEAFFKEYPELKKSPA